MAIEVTVDTRIGRTPDAVYDELAALDRWPTWLVASGIVAVDRATTGPALAGERLIVRQDAAGRQGTFPVEVTVAEPGRRLALTGKDADGVSIDMEARLAPADPASTDLHWSIRIGLPFRLRIFEGLARPQVERAAALDVEACKRRLESVAGD